MKYYDVTTELVRKLGRANTAGQLRYNASGIRVAARAAELWVDVSARYVEHEPWLAVALNGAVIARFPVPDGRSRFCVYRNKSGETTNEVEVIRETQAMFGDCEVTVHGVETDDAGELVPVRERELRLEVIGDSITSGEGAIGAATELDWIAAFFSAVNAYPRKLAAKLDADVRVFSQSGFGVTRSWDGGTFGALPNFYDQAVVFAEEKHDFGSWQPDAVIINLGTNDSGGGASGAGFKDGALAFLRDVRRHNPSAHIVWAIGMLGSPYLAELRETVAEFGDDDYTVLQLPEQTFETIGARGHPGERCHELAAEALARHLRAVLPKLKA
ncbi:MAG: GDSL-type esterase/lipase family protein [Oscillospiraceae bacterium]|jgi:lysophospholipase L1-like esterase|nr:GDSL-type esterase/lipase family protein [Oscillospiraceae bacterium]